MSLPLRWVLNGVIASGLVIAAWPLGQTAYGLWNQRSLAAQFQAAPQSKKTAQKPAPIAKTTARVTRNGSPALTVANLKPRRAARPPWPLTKLSIPDIGLETYVVQGMDEAALKRGPGHDVNSGLPGVGNCVIAGHRNVYGSFFYRLDELLPGAPITLENRDGKWTYITEAVFATPETNLTILQPPPSGQAPILTLITCTIPHTSNRIILRAQLASE